jgi:hypothetical protein
MAGTNKFIQWDQNGTNMYSDTTYAAQTAITDGVSVGEIADPDLHNKLFYQMSTMCAAWGQVFADLGYDVNDSSLTSLTTILKNIIVNDNMWALFTGDFHSKTTNGFYTTTSVGQTNAPNGTDKFYLIVAKNGTSIYHLAMSVVTGTIFYNVYNGSTWSGWSTLATVEQLQNYSFTIKTSDIISKGPWVDVRAFGAIGDGTTDDTVAIQNALNTGKLVFLPQTTANRYNISATLIPVGNQTIIGEDRSVVISQTTASADCFTLSSKPNTWIKDLTLAGIGASSTGSGINVSGSNPCHLDNLNIQGFGDGIQATSTNNLFLNKIYAVNNVNYGINLITVIDGWITSSFVGGTSNVGNTGAGIAFTGSCNGIYVSILQCQTNNINFLTQQNVGVGVPGEIFVSECINDNATVHGYYLDHANDIEFSNCWSSNRGTGKNFYISANASEIRLIGGKIFNCTGHGVEILGGNCSIVGTSIQDASQGASNTYDNINLSGASAIGTIITGVHSFKNINNPRWALYIGSGVTNTRISGCNLSTLGTGNYIDSSSNTTNSNVTYGYLCAGTETPTTVGLGACHTFQGVSDTVDYPIATFRRPGMVSATFFATNDADGSSTACVMRIRKGQTAGRSINAGGTINASGADYAEYMTKNGDFVINKGDICGIDINGKLTNVFADSVTFVVKSTNPSYVGGDTWGIDIEDKERLEEERIKVDRIAFAGQVPVNAIGATPGQYIIPVVNGTEISGIAVSSPTFEQYKISVGKVIAIDDDGRAIIIVKVA